MLRELVKALEERKSTLEREVAVIHEKQKSAQGEGEKLAREAREKERLLASINEESIKEYKALWQSFAPPSPFPCPFCYLYEKKIATLALLPRVEDTEQFRCTTCGETFEIPVELLYA